MRLLAAEAEVAEPAAPVAGPAPRQASPHWGWTAAVAAVAAVPRLLYVFVFTDPENPGDGLYYDVWHHWQIAYLTKEVGLSAPDGPRLWDLKGLEYFWGILHPLLMVGVFDVTGSTDIVLDRLVSLVFGVAVVVLVFHLCRRHWGTQTGIAAALFAAFLPTSVMNDASGMLEPLGVALCLAGLVAWPRRGFVSGIAFGLATMARAEAWLFGLGMVVAAFFRRGVRQPRLALVAGFALALGVYMKILGDHTGNPIYPLWWNFLANAVGKWEFTTVTADQASVRPVLGALLLAGAIGFAWTVWRLPSSYMLLTFGFGYWIFVTGMLGFTSYLASWLWWMPITRVFVFPYVFAGILLSALALWWLPRRAGPRAAPAGWTVVVLALALSQLAWIPIAGVFGPSEVKWQAVKADSVRLGGWYGSPSIAGHGLAVPADRPDYTYGLAHYGGVDGKHLVSEMYDPFGYLPASYTYDAHAANVDMLVQCWLAETDVRLIAVAKDDAGLKLAEQRNPTWFTPLGYLTEAQWDVAAVTVPRPPEPQCAEARSQVR